MGHGGWGGGVEFFNDCIFFSAVKAAIVEVTCLANRTYQTLSNRFVHLAKIHMEARLAFGLGQLFLSRKTDIYIYICLRLRQSLSQEKFGLKKYI